MTYSNTWITPADIEKYQLDQDDEIYRQAEYINGTAYYRFGVYTHLKLRESKQDWTIDPSKNMYLRYGGVGTIGGGESGVRYFVFNWQGERIYFAI